MAILTINDKIIQLGNDKLVFSKAGYSFDDWLTKDLAVSERVTLPETSLLNTIFLRPGSPEITGNKFNVFHRFKYSDNGKIVFSGICKLLNFNENKEYEVQLIDGSFDLFENLKNKLNALDLESSDFVFNTTNYNVLKVLNSSVFIWSASSMHENKILANNILSGNLAYSRPYFSGKRLIESMFSANGWIYELGVNCESFDNFIISANNEFLFTSFEKAFNSSLATGNIDLSNPDFIKTDTVLPVDTLNLTYNSKLRLRGNAVADNDFTLTITVSGTKPQTQTFIINKGTFGYDFTSNQFETGDSLVVSLAGTGSVNLTNFLIYTVIDENDFGNMSLANFADFKVKAYDNLPDIVQKELFKHFLVSIGGYFTTDNFKKKLIINSVVSLSKLGAVDWSSKFIEDSESISPLKGYGKTTYFEYKNSKLKPSNLGRGTFLVNNETLPDTETIYSSILAASQEVLITDTMIDNTVYGDDSGTEQRINEINPLIGYYQQIGGYTVARFENLNGNSVLLNFYSNFVAAINRGETTESNFNLNKSDYFLFDFTKLAYLEQKKSVFYVLSLSDYSENELTSVTLLKT
jgi:hypothetical protein